MTRKAKTQTRADYVEDTSKPVKRLTALQAKKARQAAHEAFRDLVAPYATPESVSEAPSDLPSGVRAVPGGYALHDGETAITVVCDLQPMPSEALDALAPHLEALQAARKK